MLPASWSLARQRFFNAGHFSETFVYLIFRNAPVVCLLYGMPCWKWFIVAARLWPPGDPPELSRMVCEITRRIYGKWSCSLFYFQNFIRMEHTPGLLSPETKWYHRGNGALGLFRGQMNIADMCGLLWNDVYIYIYKYMCQMRISRTYWIFENMSETLIGMVLSVSQLPLPVRHWRINSLPAQWNHIRAATYALEWTTLGALVWEWPWDFHTRKVRVV